MRSEFRSPVRTGMAAPVRRRLALLAGAAVLALGGCTLGPEYVRPDLDLPQSWPAPSAGASAAANPVAIPAARWWTVYGDPVLDALVDEALAHNVDAQVAAARIEEARALAGIAAADRYPALSAGASGSRTQNTLRGSFPRPAELPRTQNLSRATLEASYEIDLWGRYRRADEAARAELLAVESARSALRLSLAAQVAQQYFALLAADGQQAVLERTLALRAETRELSRRRVEAGSAAPAEFRLAEAEEAAVAAQLSEARQARERLEGALALLAGRAPRAVLAPSVPRGRPVVAGLPAIPPGLPSELLLRRPDLAESEARLIAAQARIGVARAQYFPSLALTALLGSESVALRNLFTGPAGIFQFAAAASQPIWNAGRITHGIEAAEARRDEALARYRHAVAAAFGDVRDALSADAAARARLAAETARVRALDDALRQARLRQASGAAGRLEVLDAERQRLAAELARIEAERASRAAVADLVKALGGGWAPAA